MKEKKLNKKCKALAKALSDLGVVSRINIPISQMGKMYGTMTIDLETFNVCDVANLVTKELDKNDI